MPDDRAGHWQRVYETKDTDAVSWYQAHPRLSLELIELSGVGKDARIVDAGGGASVLVDHLLAAGYADITVLDIAPAALAAAQERLGDDAGRVNWVAADVLAWRPEAPFDLWHDRAVFHFLTEEDDRRRYVKTLRHALKPGGQVIIATFAPDGPEKCSGLPVMRHDAASIAATLGDGFTLIEQRDEHHRTPAGKEQHFVYARLRRHEAGG